jgi:DNA-binding transcriptional ArsR family regulator
MDVAKVKAKLSKLVSPEVLVDETLIKLVKALAVEDMYCAEINVKFPKASKHLEILEKEGIIKREKKGFLCFYSLVKPEIADIISEL